MKIRSIRPRAVVDTSSTVLAPRLVFDTFALSFQIVESHFWKSGRDESMLLKHSASRNRSTNQSSASKFLCTKWNAAINVDLHPYSLFYTLSTNMAIDQ